MDGWMDGRGSVRFVVVKKKASTTPAPRDKKDLLSNAAHFLAHPGLALAIGGARCV
jgi:hypothetical protein